MILIGLATSRTRRGNQRLRALTPLKTQNWRVAHCRTRNICTRMFREALRPSALVLMATATARETGVNAHDEVRPDEHERRDRQGRTRHCERQRVAPAHVEGEPYAQESPAKFHSCPNR